MANFVNLADDSWLPVLETQSESLLEFELWCVCASMSLDNGSSKEKRFLSVGYASGDSQRAPLIWDRLVQFFQ